MAPTEQTADSELLSAVASRAAAYLQAAPGRSIVPSQAAIQALAELHTPLPDTPASPLEVLDILDRVGSPATVITTAGRFFGMVTGSALPASVAASWMVSAWDQNAVLRALSPTAIAFEDTAIHWVREILGLPPESAGAIVTGATMANLTGLAAARHALLQRRGWNVEEDGLFGAPPLQVVVGDEVHISLLKALSLLGLGRNRVHRVPVDGQGRIRPAELPPLDDATIVCIQAGNVNTGAFDPAEAICRKAHEAGAWVHVDGAFGLWAAASPQYAPLTAGFHDADSWATDAHKWPNSNYDCGIAFVRDADALRAAMSMSAAYAEPGAHREPLQYNPEMSRRARGVELWATLRSLGRSGLASLIERTCNHARIFAQGLSEAGFEILNDVVINQVLVSFGTPQVTKAVIDRLQQEGICWCGGTQWQGRTAMRISVSSWATTGDDVQASLAAMCRAAQLSTRAASVQTESAAARSPGS
jgi:glutamate/tyrosine decarboxylase-like PLP-dependent enzyme